MITKIIKMKQSKKSKILDQIYNSDIQGILEIKQNRFSKLIKYTLQNGKLVTVQKTFNNLYHFDNYFNKLVKAGCNIIDLQNI
tara:strand:- start:22583 stop:22831 length:249 start_codon:yes stop_codon:yes gene_type:complete